MMTFVPAHFLNKTARLFFSQKSRVFRDRRGFSLMELIVVVAVIGLLSSVGLLSFSKASQNSRNGRRKSDLEQVRAALVLYRTDNGKYPASLDFNTMSPIQTYTNVTSITDPKSGNPQYTYTSDTITFTLCATLENTTPSSYCIKNP